MDTFRKKAGPQKNMSTELIVISQASPGTIFMHKEKAIALICSILCKHPHIPPTSLSLYTSLSYAYTFEKETFEKVVDS